MNVLQHTRHERNLFFKAKLTRRPLDFASLWGISLNYDSGYLETLLFNPVE